MSISTKGLSAVQKYFLWTLWETPDEWAGCLPKESRTARSLEDRGLIECDPCYPREQHFEARIRQKGLIKADVAALMSRYTPPTQKRLAEGAEQT